MKSVLLFLAISAGCVAQEVKLEQIPTADVLRYLGVNPNDVASTKFRVSFPTAKYAALEFQRSSQGRVEVKHRIPLGPSTVFGVEVFLAPPEPGMRGRSVHYKFSTEAVAMGSVGFIELPVDAGLQKNEYAIRAQIPVVFTYAIGDVLYSLSLVSSDTPIQP